MEDSNLPDWQKQIYLREIKDIREVKKGDLLGQLYNSDLGKNGANLSVIPGKTEYFKVELFNMENRQ